MKGRYISSYSVPSPAPPPPPPPSPGRTSFPSLQLLIIIIGIIFLSRALWNLLLFLRIAVYFIGGEEV